MEHLPKHFQFKADISLENNFIPILHELGMWDTPTNFEESLSWYQALKYVLEYLLKNVIPKIENLDEFTDNLQKYYEEIVIYLNHYFDNLDVQEEINNKLDELMANGHLEDLLRNVRTATSNYISQTYNKKYNDNDFNVNLSNMNTDDFYSLWDALEQAFPNKIKSYVWGYDDFDNELKYYVITANSKFDCGINSNEEYYIEKLENNLHSAPYMFFTSGIHGNEKESIYNLYLAFKTFLYGNKSSDNFILDNFNYVILPCCNPSGIDDNTRNNRNGVNINRNLPIENVWENQEDTDKGQSAGDQKETQFIIDVLSEYSSQKFKTGMICIDWHSHHYYLHDDKRVLWFTINNYKFKQYMLKHGENLKNMILEHYPELDTDITNSNEHFIHLVTGVTQANCELYFHRNGYLSATVEVPDSFIQSEQYTSKSHKIAYTIISNTILQLTQFCGNMPQTRYNQLAQIGCTTANTLLEVIDALPNNSSLQVVLSNEDSNLIHDMPYYRGHYVHGLLTIDKSPRYDSYVTCLTFRSYGYKTPKMWIASYNNNENFYGWEQVEKSIYGHRNELTQLEDTSDPTIEQICEAMDWGSEAVIRIATTDSNLYRQCNNNLGIITIKKPRYDEVDCEIEFISSNTDFIKMYNFYFRGTLRGWKQVTLTSIE